MPQQLSIVTIYELANGTQAKLASIPERYRALRETFPPEESHFLIAENCHLLIAINHVKGSYAVSRVGSCILGKIDEDLTPAQLEKLRNAYV